MNTIPTAIPDVVVFEPDVHSDERGYFLESWHAARYTRAGLPADFVQDNQSHSVRHTLRGLHYQIERPQGKLIRVVVGEVYDVAVDLRQSSPTFGRWVGVVLSAASHRQLWVPPGFAHGFYVLTDAADLEYKCTAYYAPEHERVLAWNDPDVGIPWPLVAPSPPLLSSKDAGGSRLRVAQTYP